MRAVILIFVFAAFLASFAKADGGHYFASNLVNSHIVILHDKLVSMPNPKDRLDLFKKFNYVLFIDLDEKVDHKSMSNMEYGDLMNFEYGINMISKMTDLNSCAPMKLQLADHYRPVGQGDGSVTPQTDNGTNMAGIILQWLCLGR